MRILIYTGKGGVGKTTIAAATAIRLAESGKRTILVSTDPAHSLLDALQLPLPALNQTGAVRLVPGVSGLSILELDAQTESRRAWGELQDYFKQIIVEKANDGLAAEEALIFPGMEELCALLRILELCKDGSYDAIVVDCAPTGETLALLNYPERLKILADRLLPLVRSMNKALGSLISRKTGVPKPRDAVFTEFERLVSRLDALRRILKDRTVTSVRLVTTPEQIVLTEARRSFTWLSMYDFNVDAVYMNRLYPADALDGYFAGWRTLQEESCAVFRESFPEQKQYYLELLTDELCGMDALKESAGRLYADSDPYAIFCAAESFTIRTDDAAKLFCIRLPHADTAAISVLQKESDLLLSIGSETRRFHLPEILKRRRVSSFSYDAGTLTIRMDLD